VENVRENIIKSVRFAPSRLKYRVYIIDEVHMLSASAFNALLKTLEEPPEHAVFILATTEIHKVPATIISRCQRFDFRRISVPLLVERLKHIIKDEAVVVDEDVLQEVARHADGCARDAESLLGQILALGSGKKKISMELASLVLPATTTVLVLDFIGALAERDAKAAIQLLNGFVEQGIDMPQFMDDTIEFYRVLMFAKLGSRELLETSYNKETVAVADQILGRLPVADIQRAIDAFLGARRHMKLDKIPQLPVEMAVLDICEGERFKDPGVGSSSNGGGKPGGMDRRVKPDDDKRKELDGKPKIQDDAMSAPPIVAKAQVFDSVPVIDLNEVKDKWPDVFRELKECNASLPLMIKTGEPCAVNGDQVEIAFEYALYAEAVNRDKNKKLLEQVMTKVIGKSVRIRAKHTSAAADETVKSLLNEFGGNVI
jgi:DNA polymerase-3 subunit gamma/tau